VRRPVLVLCLGLPALAALPWLLPVTYLVHVLVLAGLYAALALSFDLVAGWAGLVSLAHPAFFGVGAYTAAILATTTGAAVFPLDLAPAMVLAGAAAWLVGAAFFRLADISFAIGTLGLGLVVYNVANNWIDLTRGPMCITGIPRFGLVAGGRPVVASYYVVLLWLAVVLACYLRLTRSRIGRAMVAVREDEHLAGSYGISPSRYKMSAFVAGAVLAAGTGVVYAHYVTVMCPVDLSTYFTVNLLIMVFLGGAGTLRGVVLGALIFTLVPEVLRLGQAQAQLLYGLVLLVVVMRLPDGLEGALARLGSRARPS
jgi:ABC-type branched-subunit amino acid transport system permease subunit